MLTALAELGLELPSVVGLAGVPVVPVRVTVVFKVVVAGAPVLALEVPVVIECAELCLDVPSVVGLAGVPVVPT